MTAIDFLRARLGEEKDRGVDVSERLRVVEDLDAMSPPSPSASRRQRDREWRRYVALSLEACAMTERYADHPDCDPAWLPVRER